MFRELVRKKKQLSLEACKYILRTERRGVISVIGDDGYPYGSPMNHFYNDEDGCIYFHCGKFGYRLEALRRCNKVSYCVFNQGTRADGEWAWTVKRLSCWST